MSNPDPVSDQEAFEGRDDDVGLNVDTWNGGGGPNGNWTQTTGVNFRIRYEIQETAGGAFRNQNFSLEYNHNSVGWGNAVNTTSLIQITTSSQYADGDATTQVIGDGSFIAGDGVESPSLESGSITIESESTEVEFVLVIDAAQVDDADTIQVRCLADGAGLDSYTQSPTITVDEPAVTRRVIVVS